MFSFFNPATKEIFVGATMIVVTAICDSLWEILEELNNERSKYD